MVKKSFKIRGNLADALDDTVSSAKNNAGELHVEVIPLRKICLDPDNPRDLVLDFDDIIKGLNKDDALYERKLQEKDSLKSIAKSIKAQGVINPVVVYKHIDQYRLIAGERRTLASIIAGRADIPAKILTVKPDPLKLSLIQWIENIEREDLSLWERIRNLEKMLQAYGELHKKSTSDITPTELSELIGCSLQQGVNYRHILSASKDILRYIESGEIKSIDKAAFISKSSIEIQSKLLQACINGSTLSELKKASREMLTKKTSNPSIGRPSTKINFGHTSNSKVAEIIICSVISSEDFKHLKPEFDAIDWKDYKSVSMNFKKLIKLIEQTRKG